MLGAENSNATKLETPHGTALFHDSVAEVLSTTRSLPIVVRQEDYQLPRAVEWAADKAIVDAWRQGRRDFDALKVRLISDLTDAEFAQRPIEVQRTRFSYARVTNDLATTSYWSRKERAERLGPWTVPFPDRRLPPLASSECSNHVGVDTLTFLTNGALVVGVQSAANAQSPGLLASSGSGSADWADLNPDRARDRVT